MSAAPHALFTLTDHRILVTGGGRGLGLQMATAFAAAGADVALASRKRAVCEEAAQALAKEFGVKAVGLEVHVADEASVTACVEAAEDALGPLTGLVNNAGTSWGEPATEMAMDAWEKVMAVNARGTFLTSRVLAKRWIDRGTKGRIVNVASVAGLSGSPPEVLDAAGYSASKAAVVGLTRDLAVKWARHGIRVNAVAPGYFPTDMTRVVLERGGDAIKRLVPLRRFGGDTELMGPALLLMSDAGGYVTGQVLAVDGGMTAQ